VGIDPRRRGAPNVHVRAYRHADRRPLPWPRCCNFTSPSASAGCGPFYSAKDYLLSELTGQRLTEPTTAAGYGIYDLRERQFSQDLADFWRVPRALLPRIQGANTLAGPLNQAGAALLGLREGIPVSTGAADSVCASFAMSGLDERVVSISFRVERGWSSARAWRPDSTRPLGTC